jgi:hypothetical protein
LDRLEQRVQLLQKSHDRVFYLADGVYSMHGDVLNARALFELLDRQPALFAYIDDAHGVGWAARAAQVRCSAATRSTSAWPWCWVWPRASVRPVVPSCSRNRTLLDRVLLGGRTLIFSGPIQPAQLGAGVASAKIHLSHELPVLQAGLQATHRSVRARGGERQPDHELVGRFADPFFARGRRAAHGRGRQAADAARLLREHRDVSRGRAPPRGAALDAYLAPHARGPS